MKVLKLKLVVKNKRKQADIMEAIAKALDVKIGEPMNWNDEFIVIESVEKTL